MRAVTTENFGLLIAYILPGFVVLVGLRWHSETISAWLGSSTASAPTISGFLYVTLASVAAGLFVSTVRWLTVDWIHHRTGITPADWSYTQLHQRVDAMEYLVANLYRYYQFYANTVIALIVPFVGWMMQATNDRKIGFVLFAGVETILWLGSRDTLRNYYRRREHLLGQSNKKDAAKVAASDQNPSAISHGKSVHSESEVGRSGSWRVHLDMEFQSPE